MSHSTAAIVPMLCAEVGNALGFLYILQRGMAEYTEAANDHDHDHSAAAHSGEQKC